MAQPFGAILCAESVNNAQVVSGAFIVGIPRRVNDRGLTCAQCRHGSIATGEKEGRNVVGHLVQVSCCFQVSNSHDKRVARDVSLSSISDQHVRPTDPGSGITHIEQLDNSEMNELGTTSMHVLLQ